MATKKDEPSQTSQTERTAEQPARTAEEATGRFADMAPQAGRQGSDMGKQVADQTASFADRELRQAADMMRQQGEQVRLMFSLPTEAYRSLTDYSKADIDAMLQSSARLARGLQEMGWEVTQFTQQSVRLSMQLANDLMECRTVEDMVSRQTDFVRESVDVLLSGSARLLSMSSRVTSDAVSPLNERMGGQERPQPSRQ
jgi:hypothetical protein